MRADLFYWDGLFYCLNNILAPINVLTPNEESIVDVGKNFFEFYLKTHQEFKTKSIFPEINHQSSFLTKVMLS